MRRKEARIQSFSFIFRNLSRWSFLLRSDWLWPLPMSVVAAGSLILMALGVFHNLVKSQQPVGQIQFKFKLILVSSREHILMQARIWRITYIILKIKIFWKYSNRLDKIHIKMHLLVLVREKSLLPASYRNKMMEFW